MVTVENVHTKVKSNFTDAEWARVKSNKAWADTFKVVSTEDGTEKKTEVPKEVADLLAGKTTQEQGAADAGNEQAPEKPKADKPAAAKPKAGNGKNNKPTN